MKLLITSHVVHYQWEGKLYAFGPYAREIEIWADLFDEVVIASPLYQGEEPPGDSLEIVARNVTMSPQHEGGGDAVWPKIKLALRTPWVMLQLANEMRKADAIHVRLPGNLGFFGAMLAPMFSDKLVAKYAGPWPDLPGESLSEIWQKKLLRSSWWKGPVTMYGDWPNLPKHVVPFLPSMLSEQQLQRGLAAAARRKPTDTLRIVFTGRLSFAKQVNTLIKSVANVRAQGKKIELRVVGDGAERQRLEKLTDELKVRDIVTFTGGVPFEQVLEELENADCLVLASYLEGFGKSIAEAMCFGLIVVGPNTGIGAQLLAGRGFTASPGSTQELTDILSTICDSPDRFQLLRDKAVAWAQRFTLEGLGTMIQDLLEEHWKLRLTPSAKASRAPLVKAEMTAESRPVAQ